MRNGDLGLNGDHTVRVTDEENGERQHWAVHSSLPQIIELPNIYEPGERRFAVRVASEAGSMYEPGAILFGKLA